MLKIHVSVFSIRMSCTVVPEPALLMTKLCGYITVAEYSLGITVVGVFSFTTASFVDDLMVTCLFTISECSMSMVPWKSSTSPAFTASPSV